MKRGAVMKYYGSIQQVQAIEDALKATKCGQLIHDGSRPFDVWGRPNKSAAYIRVWEVTPVPEARDKVTEMIRRDGLVDFTKLFQLFSYSTVYPRFWYDNRDGSAWFKIGVKAFWKLVTIMPNLVLLVDGMNQEADVMLKAIEKVKEW
jgi:hypothetical protein